MRGAFGGHVVWHAQYLVNLDDVLKGSNIACGRRNIMLCKPQQKRS